MRNIRQKFEKFKKILQNKDGFIGNKSFEGKIYVCSDIHSHLDVLKRALKTLNENDKLYIIGDVIDKGPDGIDVLRFVMNHPQCELLIGNHDLMMLSYLAASYNQDVVNEFYLKSLEEIWLWLNGGIKTFESFNKLSEPEQLEIYEYLRKLPLVRNLTVNNQRFILVHAGIPLENANKPVEDLDVSFLQSKHKEFQYDWKNDYVWQRQVVTIDNAIVITGHTIVHYYGSDKIVKFGDWYDIDGGLAMQDENSRLILLCLNDMSVQYFKP